MSAEDTTTFTAGETKLLTCIIKHCKGDIPSDYDAVAEELGYKDGGIVKQRLGQIRRKKINPATGGVRANPKKRKDSGAEGDEDSAVPEKRRRKAKGGEADQEDAPTKSSRLNKTPTKSSKVNRKCKLSDSEQGDESEQVNEEVDEWA